MGVSDRTDGEGMTAAIPPGRRVFPPLDRRGSDHANDSGVPRRKRSVHEMAAVVGLLITIGTLVLSGWRAYDGRMNHVEQRVDTLFGQLRFTNYLQCVQLRKNDPASLPPDCAPIERAWMERRP